MTEQRQPITDEQAALVDAAQMRIATQRLKLPQCKPMLEVASMVTLSLM